MGDHARPGRPVPARGGLREGLESTPQDRLLHDPRNGEDGQHLHRAAFDVGAVQQLKVDASRDITVGGANLASQALSAGLVDECILFVWPIILGGGKSALPVDASHSLELLDELRFANGVLLLRYRPRPQ